MIDFWTHSPILWAILWKKCCPMCYWALQSAIIYIGQATLPNGLLRQADTSIFSTRLSPLCATQSTLQCIGPSSKVSLNMDPQWAGSAASPPASMEVMSPRLFSLHIPSLLYNSRLCSACETSVLSLLACLSRRLSPKVCFSPSASRFVDSQLSIISLMALLLRLPHPYAIPKHN